MPRGVSRYDEADLQRRLASPLRYRPWGWWGAHDISSISCGASGIEAARDMSGNGRNMSQPDTSKQPQLVGGLLPSSSLNAIRFGGTSVLFRSENVTVGSCTILATCRVTSLGFICGVWTAGQFGLYNGINQAWYVVDANGAGDGNSANTTAKLNQWGVVSCEYTQASTSGSSIWWQGALEEAYTGAGVAANNADYGRHELGGRTFGNQVGRVFPGEIVEAMVFFPALPPSERQAMEGVMAWRAGIALAASHPFANRPPLIGD